MVSTRGTRDDFVAFTVGGLPRLRSGPQMRVDWPVPLRQKWACQVATLRMTSPIWKLQYT